MTHLFPLRGNIQHYAWGSKSEIPRLLKIENPDNRPMAEIWYGTHPKGPSHVLTGSGEKALQEVILSSPNYYLGSRNHDRFGIRLPFMLKILAAEKSLSIQVHPDRKQATEGYQREETAGIPLSAPERNYRDCSHKPECICALTDFVALAGFRHYKEIAKNLALYAPESLKDEINALNENPGEESLRGLIKALLDGSKKKRNEIYDEVIKNAAAHEPVDTARWISRLGGIHLGDPTIIAPAILNLVFLRPGEALCLEPGELHAYLSGAGIEIMAASDNVIRGGLTGKHIDTDELITVTRFQSRESQVHHIDTKEGISSLPVFTDEFKLSFFRAEKEPRTAAVDTCDGPLVILCLEGEVLTESGKEKCSLKKGDALFAGAGANKIIITGKGYAVIASVPLPEEIRP